MLTLYRPLGQRFDDFGGYPDLFGTGWARTAVAPAVDVREEEGAYVLEMELPGVAASDVEVSVDRGVLTVKGERKNEHEESRNGYRCRERSHGTFARAFTLPGGTDAEHVQARLDEGVLTLRVPRGEEPQPHRVEVKVESKEHGWLDRAKQALSKAGEVPVPTS